MLEGEVTLFVAGGQIVLGPGQAALAPRDVPHAYRVESEEARWLVITTPAGFDGFRARGRRACPGRGAAAGRTPLRP